MHSTTIQRARHEADLLRALIGLCLRDGDAESEDRGDKAMVVMLKVVPEMVMVVERCGQEGDRWDDEDYADEDCGATGVVEAVWPWC